MDLTALRSEILDLISLKTEGEYWDFKGKWHDNNADLLHDIICMANNLANRDAYLIIGVSDSKSPNGVQ
ncbi:MAG: helix-turn-helix domain-containing protein, partial [Merdibacter sp.]